MIKLTNLLKEETFTAVNKDTGKTSVFKSKDSRDAAVKAGTHNKKEDDAEKEQPKGEKPNMFSKDAGYDAPDVKSSKPKKSKPFNMDSDEQEFENALEGDGFSTYYGGSLDGVSTFGDDDGNTVAVGPGKVYDKKSAFVVSGFHDNDPANVQSKEFNSKEDAIAYAKELGQKLKKQNPTQKSKPKANEPKAAVGLPSQISKETGVFSATEGELTPKETTVKDRKFISKILSKRKFDPYKVGREEYEKRMLGIVHDALEDANFHGANRAIFADLMGRPELAKKPDYSKAPKPGSPERDAWMEKNSIYGSGFKNITSEFDGSKDLATTISSEYGWDGEKTIAAILWKMRNDGHGELADKIQTAFDRTQNESVSTRLTSMIQNENKINEASLVSFNELDSKTQSKIKFLEQLIGGKHTAIFDGIHGMIVDIKKSSMGGSYRFDASQLNQLLKTQIRWVEGDKNGVSIGF
jgi:hypothetical protein